MGVAREAECSEIGFSGSTEEGSTLQSVADTLVTISDNDQMRKDLEIVLQSSVNSVSGDGRFAMKLVGATQPEFHRGDVSSTQTSTSSPSPHGSEPWAMSAVIISLVVTVVV